MSPSTKTYTHVTLCLVKGGNDPFDDLVDVAHSLQLSTQSRLLGFFGVVSGILIGRCAWSLGALVVVIIVGFGLVGRGGGSEQVFLV